MNNSFFNFNEAPDWASAIAQTYESFNASQDRAEELEKKNDKTRIENAGVPLKIVKAGLEFSPTLKKINDSLKDRAEEKALEAGYEGISDVELDNSKNAIDDVFKLGKGENFIKKAALDNEDNRVYNTIDYSGAHGARRKWLDLQSIKERTKSEFNAWLATNYPIAFGSPTEYAKAFSAYQNGIIQNADKAGFNTKFLKSELKDTFKDLKSTFFSTQNTKLTQQNVSKEQGRMINEVTKALNSDNPETAFTETSTYNVAFFNGNLADSKRAFVNIGLMGVKAGVINPDKFESVLFGEVTAKGDKTKLLIEKLGGGPESTLWAEGILNELVEAKKGILENIETERSNYSKNYAIELSKVQGEGLMTKEELIDYVYVNPEPRWDHSMGLIPESIKGQLSAEAQDDKILIPMFEKKAKLGILTKAEVMKANSSSIRQQYLPIAISANNLGMTQEMNNMAKEAITGLVNSYTNETDGDKTKSNKWIINKQQAELLYPSLYAQAIQTAKTPQDAHAAVMKILTDNMYANKYDSWGPVTTRTLELQSAVEHLAMDKDNINTEIIVGSEKYLKEAMNYGEGSKQVHLFYEQLGKKIGVPGAVLQYNQVAIAKTMEGKDLPIKSDITLAYEKLTDEQKTLLGKYPSPARLARAKFLAFMEDGGEGEGVITWKELGVLHEDVRKFVYKEETGKELPVTPQLGKLEPRKGDWKKLPGATRIGYVVWDGKEWKYSQMRGRKNTQEWIGSVEDYKDIDGYYKPFEGRSNDLTTTFFGGDKPINTAEEGGPQVGDWYRTTNKNIGALDIGDLAGGESKPYVIWNGKEWVYSAVKGKKPNEYQGPQPLSKIQEEEEFKESLRQKNILRQQNY